ncbi:hypothetical protein M426DRAFT_266049 [Hypoxylon sp. CI-4A]|nr:hypothetical protein M426DRAFT_266049 [Hypoxylon sp. CI-4A]
MLATSRMEWSKKHVFSTDTHPREIGRLLDKTSDNLLEDVEDEIQNTRHPWKKDQANAKGSLDELLNTWLLLKRLLRTRELDSFREVLPTLLKKSELFIEESLARLSRATSLGSVLWRFISDRQRGTWGFREYEALLTQFPFLLVISFMDNLVADIQKQHNDTVLVRPIMEWPHGYWLPKSYRLYLDIYKNEKYSASHSLSSVFRLASRQLVSGRLYDILETTQVIHTVAAQLDPSLFDLQDHMSALRFLYRTLKMTFDI